MVVVDGFEEMKEGDTEKEEGELDRKYGKFAHKSWKDPYLCMRKMDKVLKQM